jgi:hypothetical protein
MQARNTERFGRGRQSFDFLLLRQLQKYIFPGAEPLGLLCVLIFGLPLYWEQTAPLST